MKYRLLTYGLLMATGALAAETGAADGASNFRPLDTDGDLIASDGQARESSLGIRRAVHGHDPEDQFSAGQAAEQVG